MKQTLKSPAKTSGPTPWPHCFCWDLGTQNKGFSIDLPSQKAHKRAIECFLTDKRNLVLIDEICNTRETTSTKRLGKTQEKSTNS